MLNFSIHFMTRSGNVIKKKKQQQNKNTSKTKMILSVVLFIKKRKSCTVISCACLLKPMQE